jgi:hypothetical protein
MTLTTNGKLHPRLCGIALDAMVLDKNGGPRDALVDRLLALSEENSIHIVEPGTAYGQTQHPNTPGAVRQVMGAQIFSLATGLTPDEQRRASQVRAVMRGNSTTDRHDADAAILFEAGKHGGYLITEDTRILSKRAQLEEILGPPFCIVILAEFLPLYDLFVEEEREREKLLATLRQ